MNRKFLLAALLASFAAVPASAQVMLDMSEVTCKQASEFDPETRQFITSWMSGYFSAEKNFNVLEIRYLKRNKEKVGAYCRKHPNDTLFAAIKKVGR